MARTKQALIDIFLKLKEGAKGYVLGGNEGKVKYMISGRKKISENKLEIETKEFK
jgi:hypothetical protein